MGYAFVMNVASLGDHSYTMAPNHVLRRANHEEILSIKETIVRLSGTGIPSPTTLWEQRWPHTRGTVEILPEENWRYHVIAFSGTNETVGEIQTEADLAQLELEIGFVILSELSNRATAWHPGRLFHIMQAANFNPDFFLRVSTSDIEEIDALRSQLQQNDIKLLT